MLAAVMSTMKTLDSSLLASIHQRVHLEARLRAHASSQSLFAAVQQKVYQDKKKGSPAVVLGNVNGFIIDGSKVDEGRFLEFSTFFLDFDLLESSLESKRLLAVKNRSSRKVNLIINCTELFAYCC